MIDASDQKSGLPLPLPLGLRLARWRCVSWQQPRMKEQNSSLRQQRATISGTVTRWSLSRSSWKKTSSTISRAWYLLMRSESSCSSSPKHSSRVHLPSSTISKQSTTLSLSDDSTMRSKASRKSGKEGRARKGASSCRIVASLLVMFMRLSIVSKPASQRLPLRALKDSSDLQQLNSSCRVKPLIWLPFLHTPSSKVTSSAFSFPYSREGHCEKLEKLLHFDCKDGLSSVVSRPVPSFPHSLVSFKHYLAPSFHAFSLSLPAGKGKHWLSRPQWVSQNILVGVASEESLILKLDYLLYFLCCNLR